MLRLVFGLLLLLLVASIVWALIPARIIAVPQPRPSASNAVWASYYHRLADQAEGEGNTERSAEYQDMASMYEWLDQESEGAS